jgi:hypothetical protein
MNDIASINNRIKHKEMIARINHQTVEPRAKAPVVLFLPTDHFSKIILASRSFGFCRHAKPTVKKPKELFFANARLKQKMN